MSVEIVDFTRKRDKLKELQVYYQDETWEMVPISDYGFLESNKNFLVGYSEPLSEVPQVPFYFVNLLIVKSVMVKSYDNSKSS